MTRALFISDLHLSDGQPAALAAFEAFVAGPAQGADALYILGDLFEYWPGDDALDTPLARQVCAALHALSEQGCRVHFLPGNRDFLVGTTFATQAGLSLMDDPQPIELDGQRFLLSHGDALCTDDHAYQAFRQQVRNPDWQRAFLAQPLAERTAIIERIRQQSVMAKQEKAAEIMDVNPDAVASLLRAHGLPCFIHGHTHRPARHVHLFADGQTERWVLSDWDDCAHWLEWNGQSLSAHRLRGARTAAEPA